MTPVHDDLSTREVDAAGSRPAAPRHNVDFLKLWAGQTISLFGSEITPIALPLIAAVTMAATPPQMAFLQAMQYAPATLLGLFAGVWVDRLPRRPIMIGSEIGRALLLLAVPLAAYTGSLRIELLYVVAFLLGLLGTCFGLAYGAFFPALVGVDHLVEGNSRLAASSSVARVAGPGLAGGLVQLLTAPVAIAIDALSFLVSALFVRSIRTPDPPPARHEHDAKLWPEIGEGLRLLWINPYLRAFSLSSAALDIFWNMLMAVYFLYLTRELRLPPAAFGLIFGIGSLGALLGAAVAPALGRRVGLGHAIVGSQLGLGLAGLLIVVAVRLPAYALPLLVAAEVAQSFMNTVFGINSGSVRVAVTPDRLRGRVGASATVVGLGVATLGLLLGGVLGERIGLGATMTIGAGGGVFAFLWLLFSPVRRLRVLAEVA